MPASSLQTMLAKAAACLSVTVIKALEVGETLASCKEAFLVKKIDRE